MSHRSCHDDEVGFFPMQTLHPPPKAARLFQGIRSMFLGVFWEGKRVCWLVWSVEAGRAALLWCLLLFPL